MHAYLITGGTQKQRDEKIQERITSWSVSPADVISLSDVDEEHIGIATVRTFQKRLLLSPFQSPYTVGIIPEAQQLTAEAQNALLKLLEEPPPRAKILCGSPSATMLLPTIVSRCEEIRVTNQANQSNLNQSHIKQRIEELTKSSTGKKLVLIDAIAKDRIQAKSWTSEAVLFLQQKLREEIEKQSPKETIISVSILLRKIMKAQSQMEHNVNPNLALDVAFIS